MDILPTKDENARVDKISLFLPLFLHRVVYCDDAMFKNNFPKPSLITVASEFGFEDDELGGSKNSAQTVDLARQALRHPAISLVDLDRTSRQLANMRVLTLCQKSVALQYDAIAGHADNCGRCKNLIKLTNKELLTSSEATEDAVVSSTSQPQKRSRQSTLSEGSMPIVSSQVPPHPLRRSLIVSSFTAGGNGAAGVPPSSIPALLSPDTLELIRALPSGHIPSTYTIINSDLPNAVTLVQQHIASQLRSRQWAASIDANTCDIDAGVAVLVLSASHPEVGDCVLDVGILQHRETAEIQANFIRETLSKCSIPPKSMICLAGDRGAANESTVNLLRQDSDFASLRYIPCAAHGLNRILFAIVNTANNLFRFVDHTTLLQSWVNAGGSTQRMQHFKGSGFSKSWLSVDLTKWESVALLAVRLVSVPRKRKAAVRNTPAGDECTDPSSSEAENDADSEDEYEDGTERNSTSDDLQQGNILLNQLQRYICSDAFTTATDFEGLHGVLKPSPDRIAEFFSSFTMLAVCKTLAIIFHAVPTAFRILSRGSSWATGIEPEQSAAVDVTTAASIVRELITLTRSMGRFKPDSDTGTASSVGTIKGSGATILKEVQSFLDDQVEFLVASARERGEFASDKDEAVPDQDNNTQADKRSKGKTMGQPEIQTMSPEERFRELLKEKTKAALLKVRYFLLTASQAVTSCAALPKLENVLLRLRLRDYFSINSVPPDISEMENSELEQLMGVQKLHFDKQVRFLTEWERHRDTIKQTINTRSQPVTASDTDAYKYYLGIASTMPLVSAAGCRALTLPVSTAYCEHVCSLLTQMDSPNRRTTKETTLRNILFLRANAHIVQKLRQAEAERLH